MLYTYLYNMYIRIEFEDIENHKTKETQELFSSRPNGMFLRSSNAHRICTKEIQEAVDDSVFFWYLDIDVLNKHYGGVIYCLNELVKYPGVSRVDMLPIEVRYYIEGRYYDEKFDDLITVLIRYVDGV